MSKQIKYVLGFMFTPDNEQVVLINKEKPDWQKGLKNGVGGKLLDQYESPADAMCREFEEETGIVTENDEWIPVIEMGEKDWSVHVYAARSDSAYNAETMESERIELCSSHIDFEDSKIISNLSWLIPMSLDKLRGNFNYNVQNLNP